MDQEIAEAPTTLRDALESSFEAAESGNLPAVVERTTEVSQDRIRDEQGKFAREAPANPSPVATKHDIPDPVDHSEPPLQRPTTWKKDYLPLWDKMQAGQPLTLDEANKFLRYANQRETEYKTGVSTYKAEAENAKALQEAIAPFAQDLQKNGIRPADFIGNLGRAHHTLVMGNDQQRLQAFMKLANEYRVPLQYLVGTNGDNGQIVATMQELTALRQQVDKINSQAENDKQSRLMAEISRVQSDTEKFPHFEAVRGTMAQLLESGLAPNLEAAYAKAVRMQDDVWQVEQERLLSTAMASTKNSQQVAKAKAAAVSVKTSTPSGMAASSSKKDRRSSLEEAFDSIGGGRV